ncbi:MAG: hypothetical protein V7L04_31575 [Nostoc sp.]|uniref:hypothetical protein n=1 Tax=Nostoc sp. TaxID=1180 RepID=UPI002FF5525C
MYWLAINRELTTITDLARDFVPAISQSQLLQVIESFIWRSLIEKNANYYTQRPTVMEYITEQLHHKIVIELVNKKFSLFNRLALIVTTAKDDIRATQMQLIMQPIADKLYHHFLLISALEQHILDILAEVQQLKNCLSSYGSTNLNHLCYHLKIELAPS